MNTDLIRNFCIIAHIDHGKSTLADRILVRCGALALREMQAQVLDSMELERERGITIKAKAVALEYKHGGKHHRLNLIDTPGHVDFSYEVSRSLAACEGALLLVDAAQGVQAQTMANFFLALEAGLEIVPVLNKVDLQAARPEEVMEEMEALLGILPRDVLRVSAKTGEGVDEILEAVIVRVPAPKGNNDAPLQAFIFDSLYDEYRGVIIFVRIRDGTVHKGDRVFTLGTRQSYEVVDLGKFRPKPESMEVLEAGEVGWLVCNIKTIHDVKIGDTITLDRLRDEVKALPGYREPKPMVFCGLYPVSNADFEPLRKALEKLHLQDSSFTYHPESSEALGFGFRCGFLGLLHMEIVQERLEREFSLDLIASAPSVEYHVIRTLGRGELVVDNPALLPNPTDIEEIQEPWVKLSVVTPSQYIGPLMELSTNRRGDFSNMEYLDPTRVVLHFEMPLAELIVDYFDQLKSRSQGYASMDYEELGYRPANLAKVDILVNGEPVDALSLIVHRDRAQSVGRQLAERLKQLIPRQMFEIPIQAAIGSNVVARETVRAMRKNVLAKCYGGDITRKRKLLEKQKEGKQRMKRVGSVEIPQEAFLAMLRMDEG
jgi:GTP-binding protein LepA